jgi:hypothetical protein
MSKEGRYAHKVNLPGMLADIRLSEPIDLKWMGEQSKNHNVLTIQKEDHHGNA